MQTVKKRVNELLKNTPSGVAGSIYIPIEPDLKMRYSISKNTIIMILRSSTTR